MRSRSGSRPSSGCATTSRITRNRAPGRGKRDAGTCRSRSLLGTSSSSPTSPVRNSLPFTMTYNRGDMATPPQLKLHSEPKLNNATLLLALTGWMDGGDVPTGTVKTVMGKREVKRVATIDPEDFYIYNFPGSM